MMKPIDHFEVAGYEVRFLQSAPVTVCVIRSLTDRRQKYTGVSVCHPDDKWDETIGRHKALKDALHKSKSSEFHQPIKTETHYEYNIPTTTMIFSYGDISLPIKKIQHAYYWHYMRKGV